MWTCFTGLLIHCTALVAWQEETAMRVKCQDSQMNPNTSFSNTKNWSYMTSWYHSQKLQPFHCEEKCLLCCVEGATRAGMFALNVWSVPVWLMQQMAKHTSKVVYLKGEHFVPSWFHSHEGSTTAGSWTPKSEIWTKTWHLLNPISLSRGLAKSKDIKPMPHSKVRIISIDRSRRVVTR